MTYRTGDTLLEVLVYKISHGQRAAFHEALQRGALPQMEEQGFTVVGFGPSRHDQDSYYLLRAYPSMEYRARVLERCRGDGHWLKVHQPEMGEWVESCSVAVLPCEPAGIEKLKHTVYY